MEEKTVARMSLASGALGLLFLFAVSFFIDATPVSISGIESVKDMDVTVKGQVTAVKESGNLAVVEIAEIKSLNVVVFDKGMIKFKVGDNISVGGEIRNYKGKKELIAESIKVSG